jgi:hypothetical protein
MTKPRDLSDTTTLVVACLLVLTFLDVVPYMNIFPVLQERGKPGETSLLDSAPPPPIPFVCSATMWSKLTGLDDRKPYNTLRNSSEKVSSEKVSHQPTQTRD